jgi:hypothetical protein
MKPVLIVSLLLVGSLAAQPVPLTGPSKVAVEKEGDTFLLKRNGEPYYVKGIGGQRNLELGIASGANSIRTWNSGKALEVLDQAAALGMTVTVGVWLDHKAEKYSDSTYKDERRKEVTNLIAAIKDHPALLCYALGNETNSGADTPEAWGFIDELAEMVHKGDPNHPTMTVLAGSGTNTINNVATYAPAIDILGINSYRGVVNAPKDVEASNFKGPYMITEWGPYGHWEVERTAWRAPIEQNSDEKAKSYESSYKLLLDHSKRCVGSYVFLWGQKQERTPTWYGMFLEKNEKLGVNAEATASVDVMTTQWSGKKPANTAPSFTSIKINGATPVENFTVKPDEEFTMEIAAADAEGDTLSYVWEVLPEATKLGQGGSFEPRPEGPAGAIAKTDPAGSATVKVATPGNYRVFGYVLDGKGKAATVNIPFQVKAAE